ncbi:MAG: hypothetical protein SF187_27195 [Deltaproteobacteria bacterium]|nr:hypothetical protein [Deltaproteobacteria bacterium]
MSDPGARKLWPAWLVPGMLFGALALLLLLHVRHFATFLSDDALISLRYARRLVQGQGLTWTGNERVEGYTDLLWVLLTAIGGLLHSSYIGFARFLDHVGVFSALAIIGLSPRTGRWSAWRFVGGGILWVASAPVAVWANGGLEHGFMTGVLALLIYRLARDQNEQLDIPAAVAAAALVLLRADGVVLVACAFVGAFLARQMQRQPSVKRLARTLALAVVVFVAQMLFRRGYYGAWQPNTALAKLAFNQQRVLLGLTHVWQGYQGLAILVAAAIAGTVWLVHRNRTHVVVMPWLVVLGWSGYLVAVGGDIFPGWRQLLFVLVPLSLLVAEVAESVAAEQATRVALTSAGLGIVHWQCQTTDAENQRAKAEVWEWDGVGVGRDLKAAFGAQAPLLAVDAAGALPYFSELPSLDMLGLIDAYIASHPPPSFGHGGIGHELGDGDYVFRREPDIIAFNSAAGQRQPRFLSGVQLLRNPAFHERYQWIRMQSFSVDHPVLAELWLRHDGGKLGVLRGHNDIRIPGYFLAGDASAAVARVIKGQGLVTEITDARPGVARVKVPAGRWQANTNVANAALGLLCDGLSMGGGTGAVFELQEPREVQISVAPAASAAFVSQLTLSRTTAGPPHVCVSRDRQVVVASAALAAAKPEGFAWNHPSNVLVGSAGLVTNVDTAATVTRLEMSTDNNDAYAVEIRRGEAALWTGQATPVVGNGLHVHVLPLPMIAVQPGDEIRIVPRGGDGHYSVGHVILN